MGYRHRAVLPMVWLLSLLMLSGVGAQRPPRERGQVLLKTASGVETAEFQLLDSVIYEAVGLKPYTVYTIRIVDETGDVLSESRLSTDGQGRIPETSLWYDIGLPTGAREKTAPRRGFRPPERFLDPKVAGRTFTVQTLAGAMLVEATRFSVSRTLLRPRLYSADRAGVPKSWFLVGEDDVYVVGQNFPKHSVIRLWMVTDRADWRDGVELEDMTKQYPYSLPGLIELKGDATSFRRRVWPRGLTSVGSYDIVAEVVTYPFGRYRVSPTAQVQDVVSHKVSTGFVVQRRPELGAPLEMPLSAAMQSPLVHRDSYLTTDTVYVYFNPAEHPAFVGQTAEVYIVPDQTEAQWVADSSLVGKDVTGPGGTPAVETIIIQGCGNCFQGAAWFPPLTPGEYDVVLDFNQDGVYTNGVDLIDSLAQVGFTVSEIRLETISFNYPGASGTVTIEDHGGSGAATAPEYSSSAYFPAKPAAWVIGAPRAVRATFQAVPGINSAQVWAEGGLGGLNSGLAPVTVTFVGSSGEAVFDVNTPPTLVDKRVFQWDWNYKNLNGGASAPHPMAGSGDHTLYSLVAAPQAPQAQPWVKTLDVACTAAMGQNTPAGAARAIWYDFYTNPGGTYDTAWGDSQYTSWKAEPFDLTSWLTNYDGGSIGTVNCYDMGKSVAVFANALGCGTVYTFVDPFGYLNCIQPIGCGCTNNPFDAAHPVVPGDSGRTSFGNHGFTRLNGMIYDASVGYVDSDIDPDDCPCDFYALDGDDSWGNNYRNRVIDNVPASNPGAPTNYSSNVY